jgi:DNA-binding CsgD family transcriptional regulator
MAIRTAELARNAGIDRLRTEFPELSVPADRWSALLGRMRRDLRGRIIILASYDFLTGTGHIQAADNVAADYFAGYARHPSVADLFPRRVRDGVNAEAPWTDDELVIDADFRTSAFFNTWLRPQGVVHFVAGSVGCDGGEVTYVLIGRGEAEGPFSAAELALCGALLPFLKCGVEMGSLAERLRHANHADFEIFDLLPIGIIIVDRLDRPIAINRYARTVVGSPSTLAGLLAKGDRRTKSLCAAKAAAMPSSDAACRAIALDRGDELPPLSAVICPLVIAEGGAVDDRDAAAVIFISDPTHVIVIDRERLQRFYRLTPAEARLAALLAEGRHLDSATAALGITLHTARTHLKRIFSKTGAQSQADLVRLVLDMTNQVGQARTVLAKLARDAAVLAVAASALLSA